MRVNVSKGVLDSTVVVAAAAAAAAAAAFAVLLGVSKR